MEDLLQFLSGNIGAALFAAAAGYLLGSINFAIIVTRFTVQQDIRTVGSGNAGTTNVLRAAGKMPAFITLMGDFLKAIAAVIVGKMILMNFGAPELALSARLTFGAYIGAFSCLLGHLFPCYFNFKGGKGVMTCLLYTSVVERYSMPILHVLVTSLNNEENDELILVENDRLDLKELVLSDLLLNLPMKHLCREDCKGLCPKCGANLNEGECGCNRKPVDPRFAALRDLLD